MAHNVVAKLKREPDSHLVTVPERGTTTTSVAAFRQSVPSDMNGVGKDIGGRYRILLMVTNWRVGQVASSWRRRKSQNVSIKKRAISWRRYQENRQTGARADAGKIHAGATNRHGVGGPGGDRTAARADETAKIIRRQAVWMVRMRIRQNRRV